MIFCQGLRCRSLVHLIKYYENKGDGMVRSFGFRKRPWKFNFMINGEIRNLKRKIGVLFSVRVNYDEFKLVLQN
jgi:hypothetical protein